MERLADPAHYINDPDQSWKRVRISGRKPEALGRLKALARWRELEAQGKDLPRGRIMKDETLADLALSPPKKQADLARVRSEEHTSELQSLMRISYAVFCLKKKKKHKSTKTDRTHKQ